MLKTGRERNTAREEQQQRQQKRRQNPNKWLNGIRSVHSTHKIFPSYTFSPRIPCNKHTHNTLTRSFGAHSFFFLCEMKFNAICLIWPRSLFWMLCFLFRQPVRVSHTNRFFHFYTLLSTCFAFNSSFWCSFSTIYLVAPLCVQLFRASLYGYYFRRNRSIYISLSVMHVHFSSACCSPLTHQFPSCLGFSSFFSLLLLFLLRSRCICG